MNEFLDEIPVCMMLSNFVWGSWGVNSFKLPIKFDYVNFCQEKFNKY